MNSIFRKSPQVQLIAGIALIGLAPILIRASSLPPTTSAFYRCLFGTIFSAAFLIIAMPRQTASKHFSEDETGKRMQAVCWMMLVGVIFAADLIIWHRSIAYVGAGIATVLANTQVFYLGLFHLFATRPSSQRFFWISVLTAFAGISVIASRNGVEVHQYYDYGVLYGLLTGVVYATFIATMGIGERKLSILNRLERIALMSASTSIITGVVAWLAGESFSMTWHDLVLMMILGGVSHLGGWWLIGRSLQTIPSHVAGLYMLMQPVFAFLFAWVLLGERLDWRTTAGVAMTLAGLVLYEFGRSQHRYRDR